MSGPIKIDVSLLDTSRCRLVSERQVRRIIAHRKWLLEPITITNDRVVVDGGHRVAAFKKIGRLEIDAIEVDGFPPPHIDLKEMKYVVSL